MPAGKVYDRLHGMGGATMRRYWAPACAGAMDVDFPRVVVDFALVIPA